MIKGQAAFGDLTGDGEQNIVISSWDDKEEDKNAVYCYSPFDKDGDHKPRFTVGEEDSVFNASKSGNSQFRWEFGWDNGGYY